MPPIDILIDEILVEVMWEVLLSITEYERYRNLSRQLQNPPYRGFLIITHVCRRWRQLAVSTSKLWSFIELGDEGVLQFCLERSKNARILHIFHTWQLIQCFSESAEYVPYTPCALHAICTIDIVERLGTLKVTLEREHMSLLVETLNSCRSIPNLRQLTLAFPIESTVIDLSLPLINLDCSKMQGLTNLCLSPGISPMYSRGCLENAEYVNLGWSYGPVNVATPPGHVFDVHQFLDAVGSRLQILVICSSSPVIFHSENEISQKKFPRLSSLELRLDSGSSIRRFLRCITTPSIGCKFHLMANCSSFRELIPPSLISFPTNSIVEMQMIYSANSITVVIEIYDDTLTNALRVEPQLSATAHSAMRAQTKLLDDLTHIFASLPIQRLKIPYEDAESETQPTSQLMEGPAEVWTRFFHVFNNMKFLDIPYIPCLVESLAGGETARNLPCKNLETLIVRVPGGSDRTGSDAIQTIIRCVEARRKTHPLQTICLLPRPWDNDYVGLSEDVLYHLEMMIENVELDEGLKYGYQNETDSFTSYILDLQ